VQNPDSATSLVASLEIGETYTWSRFIPSSTPDLGNAIRQAKRELSKGLSPVLARAQSRSPSHVYTMHSIHSLTSGYDVVVVTVVVRELGL